MLREPYTVYVEPPNPSGLCQCGCGAKTSIASVNDRNKGHASDHPIRFIAGHNGRLMHGSETSAWKGGRMIEKGYVRIRMPEHPYARSGYVAEHRLVMEAAIGRYLTRQEIVHHINRDRSDNRIENLRIETRSSHLSLHRRGKP